MSAIAVASVSVASRMVMSIAASLPEEPALPLTQQLADGTDLESARISAESSRSACRWKGMDLRIAQRLQVFANDIQTSAQQALTFWQSFQTWPECARNACLPRLTSA